MRTLDNLYAAGERSDDGGEWSTGANASTLDQTGYSLSAGLTAGGGLRRRPCP